jgi:hypothetical protein
VEALSYIVNSLRFPDRRDYLQMSAGIRARSRRCRQFWKPHLELSRLFINSSLGTKSEQVVVMGAGMLLDIDASFLDANSKQVQLIDIDPTLKKYWKRSFPRRSQSSELVMTVADLTGSMDSWYRALGLAVKNKSSIEEVVALLRSLKPEGEVKEFGVNPEIVISINLLGQLGVYWRDRAASLLKADPCYFEDSELPVVQIREAIEASIVKLEMAHLALLAKFSRVILLSDIYYHYYKKNLSDWQTENALSVSGAQVVEFFIKQNFNLEQSDSWLWHIAPQDIENPEYGEIHEVNAFYFKKS